MIYTEKDLNYFYLCKTLNTLFIALIKIMELKAKKMQQNKEIECYITILQLKISESFEIKINSINENICF